MSKARFSGGKLMNVILERFPYRYVECGTLENGFLTIVFKSSMNTHKDTKICTSVTTEHK